VYPNIPNIPGFHGKKVILKNIQGWVRPMASPFPKSYYLFVFFRDLDSLDFFKKILVFDKVYWQGLDQV